MGIRILPTSYLKWLGVAEARGTIAHVQEEGGSIETLRDGAFK